MTSHSGVGGFHHLPQLNIMTPEQRANGMLLGAFVGDALALGPHWNYERSDISTRYGRITGYLPPGSDYHPGKQAGDLTHLGDQMMLLQQNIVSHDGLFDAEDFIESWKQYWLNPTTISYKDKATKMTLANLVDGQQPMDAGSTSSEFAGVARGMPVLATGVRNKYDEQSLIAALKLQTRLTHRAPEAIDVSAFLGRLISGLDAGLDIETSLDGSLGDSSQFIRDVGGKAEASNVAKLSTGAAIETLGQACEMTQALPSTILLLRRHGGNFEEALIENVMAGGDSAARGIVVGAVLGYLHGVEAIPEAWRTGLRQPIPGLNLA